MEFEQFKGHRYENLLSAANNSLWFSTDQQLDTIKSVIEGMTLNQVAELRDRFLADNGGPNGQRPLVELVNDRTAVINISGVIMKKMNLMMAHSGGTSADMVAAAARRLGDMERIENVILRVDSGGGSVHGIDVAAEALRELRTKKRVLTVADDVMASAAYYLGSAADKIFVNPSSAVGSIGVISRIQNIRKALEDKGIEIHTFRAGEFKQVPNAVEEVTDKGKQIVQSDVNKFYNDFVQAISLNRNISLDEARSMADGKVHKGSDAIDAGLADEEGTFEDVLQLIESEDEIEDQLSIAMGTIEAQSEEIAKLAKENVESKKAIKEMTEAMAESEARELKLEAERVVDAAIDSGKVAPMKRDDLINMALSKGVDTVESMLSMIPEGANTPKADIKLGSDSDEHSDDPFAPKDETERRIMSQFGPLRERYNL